jgi:hypothetical protein
MKGIWGMLRIWVVGKKDDVVAGKKGGSLPPSGQLQISKY